MTMLKLLEYAKKGEFMGNNFTDQTGNLRSSIGYIIYHNGSLVRSNFSGTTEGTAKGQDYAKSLLEIDSEGYVCVFVAGMEYAMYVESKGYGVISGPHLQFDNVFQENIQALTENIKIN